MPPEFRPMLGKSHTIPVWSVSVLEQQKLNENISVAIRMRSSGNSRTRDCSGSRKQSRENASHKEEQQLTAGELRDLSNNPEL